MGIVYGVVCQYGAPCMPRFLSTGVKTPTVGAGTGQSERTFRQDDEEEPKRCNDGEVRFDTEEVRLGVCLQSA